MPDMKEVLERFIAWAKLKCRIQKEPDKDLYFHKREVWWAHLGANIGHEMDGKHEGFERPILVVKKLFGGSLLLVFPLTTSEKDGSYYVRLEYEEGGETKPQWVILAQMRTISRKRLIRKIRRLPVSEFNEVMRRFGELLK